MKKYLSFKINSATKYLLRLAVCLSPLAVNAQHTVAIAEPEAVITIQSNIQTAIDGASNGETVTVAGSKTDADVSLSLHIPADVTVVRKAGYANTKAGRYTGGDWIIRTSSGIFEVAAGTIANNDQTKVISVTPPGTVEVKVTGGTVKASSMAGANDAICAQAGNINVSSDTVVTVNDIALFCTSGNMTAPGGTRLLRTQPTLSATATVAI
jgi:hypothetical protein